MSADVMHVMRRNRITRCDSLLHTSIAIALTLAAVPRLARAASPESATREPERLESIVVTATRREEISQQVPIAITAFSNDSLRREQITDVSRLQYVAPTLVIWPVIANSLTATISMRGMVEPDLLPTNDPAVGTYLDGVYIARMTGANLELVDMQRVEILRGPQGTLFGRNTIGGAINLVPNRPAREFASEVTVGGGNYTSMELEGLVNLPVDSLAGAVRIAGKHSQHSGYGRAVLLDRDLSDENLDYLRAQLELAPADGWSVNLSGDLTSVRSGSELMTLVAAFDGANGNPGANDIPGLSGNPDDELSNYTGVTDGRVKANRAGNFEARIWGSSVTIDRRLGHGSLRSITAFRRLDLESHNTDGDGTPYDLFATPRRLQAERQFSQEFQFHGSSADARTSWMAGLLYFYETADLDFHNLNLVPISQTETLVHGTTENESAAAYVQLTHSIGASARITAGARYNLDWRQLVSRNAGIEAGVEFCRLDDSILDKPGECEASLPRREFGYVPWTVGIDYAPREDALLYAKISRGFRAGGYNMRGGTPVSMLTFDPESVISYELGAKADFADGRLRANVALYRANYEEMQLGARLPDPIQGVTFIKQNGGIARILGGEAEVTAVIGRLRMSVALGVTDGKYLELAPSVDDITLDSALALPRTTVHLAADLPMYLRSGEVDAHVDYGWHSEDGDSKFHSRCSCHNAYGLLNAMLVFLPGTGNLRFELWGHNLADTHYMAQWVDFDDFINSIPGEPRTYGVRATYNFGIPAANQR
jgi:iron complex outermembrane receptor protein